MTGTVDLFSELQPDMEAVADPLIRASEVFVAKRGAFLPHGAVLETDGRATAVMIGDGPEMVSSIEILPRLHDALRALAAQRELRAVAVCEDVTITPPGAKPTKAIKVLVEHRRGLTAALYLPWRRRLLGGCEFGKPIATPAQAEVRPWEPRPGPDSPA
jgi:hypothetical protein